jgi:hypothetical protein
METLQSWQGYSYEMDRFYPGEVYAPELAFAQSGGSRIELDVSSLDRLVFADSEKDHGLGERNNCDAGNPSW